jgi:hypothetical protein
MCIIAISGQKLKDKQEEFVVISAKEHDVVDLGATSAPNKLPNTREWFTRFSCEFLIPPVRCMGR